ncbi:MAG: DUF3606 domain-containing protein [Agriterribacter sp.]
MGTQTTNSLYTQQEIDYFVQKFNVTPEQVKEAIQKVGDSSENLEQYFRSNNQAQAPGDGVNASEAHFSQKDLKGKKVDAFPDTEEDKPLDQSDK